LPRLSPEELSAARKARQAEKEAARAAEEAAQVAALKEEEERDEWLIASLARYDQLDSVVDGLYQEHDKLAKKWPTMPITQRSVDRVNKLIQATRSLLKEEEDDFAEGLEEIVAAGDPPETRDVVMILSVVRDALNRFDARHRAEWRRVEREYDV
jgi:hypothetical protein